MASIAVEFDDFVRDRSARLLRVAYLFTRDHALAEDLLQTTYARCWPSWRRIDGDPEPYVRRALVNTYNSWWRRKWNGELPSDDVPDRSRQPAPQDGVEDRDAVWRALRRLPRQQQIVVVLRYFEDLTEAEIADVMQVSPGAVKGYASKALARLRADPSLTALALPQVEPTLAGNDRVAGVRTRIRRARRLRAATVGTAVLVVLSLVAAVLIGLTLRNKPVPTPIGPSPSPSRSPFAVASDATYFDGKHVVTSLPATASGQAARLRWKARPDRLSQLFILCVRRKAPDVVGELWAGKQFTGVVLQCDQTGRAIAGGWWLDADFQAMDMDPADGPVDYEVRLKDPSDPAKRPKDGSVAMLVVERSTTAEYHYPPAPAQRKPIPRPTFGSGQLLRFEAGRPLAAPFGWRGRIVMTGRSDAPGILHIDVDGVEVGTLAWWDYLAEERKQWSNCASPRFELGKTVTVSVRPENMQGDWFVDIEAYDGAMCGQ